MAHLKTKSSPPEENRDTRPGDCQESEDPQDEDVLASFTTEEEDVVVEEHSPDHRIVFNSVILQNIFRFLTTNGIKKARLVCTHWEEEGCTVLGKRAVLSINKFCSSRSDDGLIYPLPINDQLLRSLKFVFQQTQEDDGQTVVDEDWTLFPNQFVPFITVCSEHVEEIRVELDRYFLRLLKLALENNNFSNLSKISLLEHNHWENEDEDVETENLQRPIILSVLPKIKTLEISATEDRKGKKGPSGQYPYHGVFQELVKKSPNVEVISIEENFYPDLGTCTKLKSLEWRGYPFVYDEDSDDRDLLSARDDISLSKIMTMVGQVRNSLQILIIGSLTRTGSNPYDELTDVRSKLPRLPRLTSLSIDDLEIFESLFVTFDPNELPALQRLSIHAGEDDFGPLGVNPFYLRDLGPFKNVNSLFLNQHTLGPGTLEYFGVIAQNFPSLTDFSVTIEPADRDLVTDPHHELFRNSFVAMAAALPNLVHLTIQINFKIGLKKLMETIARNAFNVLKTLKLVVEKPSLISENASCNNFDKPFLAFPSLTFDGFSFKGSTGWRMYQFIRQHNCNVYFIN